MVKIIMQIVDEEGNVVVDEETEPVCIATFGALEDAKYRFSCLFEALDVE